MADGFPKVAQDLMVERFSRDSIIAIATIDGGRPCVRNVDGYYENGSFYTITHALSGKMQQIAKEPKVAICGEWFTAHGTGENIGHVCAEKNKEIADKMRKAFAAWYDNGHTNEADPNTCILRVRLTDGVLLAHGTRYDIDFTASE
ncbi:MAG: pyridoxamine 5'-phosphate oxidase family protein [Eubacteriales bacterium]|nr:pyridoxamine 5'-phosphate oxidase family protein [Eubacteriales bacterium]MDD3882657.1 pyridoxamine 5'-phosphate oxidase family protein [Eubacteriales bacterium]MDD4512771.1 pyridoxamine 5'-phosphate oxidase family protein [Eubacteriales bacterium]